MALSIDPKLYGPDELPCEWNIDINVVDGYCEELPSPSISSEEQQRANICAFMEKGTIPGLPDVGVDWMGFYTGDLTLMNINGLVHDMIDTFLGENAGSWFTSFAEQKDGTISVAARRIQ
jgi:hypothetical protein